MPKEKIYDAAGDFTAQVGWMPGQNVQIAVLTADGRSLADLVQSWKDEDGQGHKSPGGDYVRSDGLWATLDREGCNRLIRSVRRARDAAFGADA